MIDRITRQISIWMMAGIVVGGLCGFFVPTVGLALSFIGQLFLGGLKLLVIPLIITGTIAGINAFGDMRRAGRFSGQVLLYFLGSTVVAAIVGVVMVMIINPGSGVAGSYSAVGQGWSSVSEALGSLMPGNLVTAISEGKYLGVVLLALFLGGMLTAMGVKGRTAVTLFKNIHEGLLRVLGMLLLVAPLGLFSLVAAEMAKSGLAYGVPLTDYFLMGGQYLLTVVLALFVHGFLLLPLAVQFMGRRSSITFLRNLTPAFFTAFGTSSSIATFPVTYRCLSDKCEVDERATSMVLPLGSVINLQGTVICMIVATLFAAQVAGVSFGLFEVIGVAALAVLLSIGASGMPSATLLAAPVLFGVIGLAPAQIAMATGIVVGLDWLVDRLRAMVNVGGDAAGAVVLAESFELKTARRTGRERRPSRPPRGGRQSGREPSRSDSGSRPTSHRQEKAPRTAEPTRGRGRRPAADKDESPTRTRGGRTRTPRQERTPFEMKAPSTPALGAEGGSTPSGRQATESRTESDSKRPQGERRRSSRSTESGTTERQGRGRGRTPADRSDKPAEPKQRAPRSAAPKSAPRRRAEVAKPAPVEPEPISTPLETENKSAGDESGRVSRTTMARELAKVSAQLRDPEVTDGGEMAPEKTPEVTPEKPAAAPRRAARPKPPAPEPVVETPVVVESVPEPEPVVEKEKPAPTFGRTRRYKGAAIRKDKVAPQPKEDPPKVDEKPKPVSKPAPAPEPKVVPEPVAEAPKVEEPAKPAVVEAPKVEAPEAPAPAKPAPVEPTPAAKVEPKPEPKDEPAETKPEQPSFGRTKKKRTRK